MPVLIALLVGLAMWDQEAEDFLLAAADLEQASLAADFAETLRAEEKTLQLFETSRARR